MLCRVHFHANRMTTTLYSFYNLLVHVHFSMAFISFKHLSTRILQYA
jgi:hypothetical protein